jgi:RND family efflux transporter MFP subunit
MHTSRTISYSLTALATVALAACGNADAKSADSNTTPAIPVAVASVTTDAVAQPVIATGTFGSRDEIPLSFKIGGVIARVTVDQGATVQRGQVLAALDLREIDAMLDKARVGVEKAERDAARLRRLAADSVATLAQLQDATSALDAAKADYAAAKVNREYATIVAPEAGVVLQRQATPGAMVGAGTTILTIGGSNRGRVLRAGIPDRDALRVRVGNAAQVRFDALPNTKFAGTVSLLGKAADARTGTYTVEVQLRDAASLPNGLVGHVEIAVRSTTTAAMIPVDALLEADADSALVYTVSASTPLVAEQHKVRIAQLVGDKAAVTGLENGARVITSGAPYVTPGARVEIAKVPTTMTANAIRRAAP